MVNLVSVPATWACWDCLYDYACQQSSKSCKPIWMLQSTVYSVSAWKTMGIMIWQCLIIFINSFLHPFFHFPIKASISNVENPFCGLILNHAVNWSCFVLEPFYIVIFGVAKKLSGYFCFAAKLHYFLLLQIGTALDYNFRRWRVGRPWILQGMWTKLLAEMASIGREARYVTELEIGNCMYYRYR